MAKKNMTDKLSSALQSKQIKKPLLKKSQLNDEEIERDVKKMSGKGETKKISLIVSTDLHKDLRKKTIEIDSTIQDYLHGLLIADLKK
jgi:hypothetical protein